MQSLALWDHPHVKLPAFCFLFLFCCRIAASAPAPNNFDGPAELPRVYVKSSLADTPTPGNVHLVNQGDNLQAAIDSAKCGDTLKLQAGADFQGLFRFPNKSCDDSHWIIIRTAAPDADLPAENSRLTPCYAGIPALPARPDCHCGAPKNVVAKLEFAGREEGPILFLDGASHYRFIGLEITRTDSETSINALIAVKDGGTANHLIFDRVWVHGTAQSETKRGVALSAMTYAAVVDSYFSDFHCIAGSGSCTDAQTMSAGGGEVPEGPFKIVNNFLEASGENLIFGGRPAKTTPTDIEIRRNHLFKPMIWMPGQPGFVGGFNGHPFIVKNHFELKNAQRVLFEDNLLENCWGGFSQAGFSILLSPKNQQNHCPSCLVTDVTIRFIKIVNVASIFQIANNRDAGGASAAGERYSIHDVLAEDIHGRDYGGFGLFALILSDAPPLHDVQIEHVTSSSVPRFIFSIISPSPRKIANFTFANNIVASDQNLEIGSAGGGDRNCAAQPERQGPEGIFKSCFENSTFTRNIVGGGANWPKGNIMVSDLAAAGVRITKDGGAGQYELCEQKEPHGCKKRSPAIAAGTDGKNIGADVDQIEKQMGTII